MASEDAGDAAAPLTSADPSVLASAAERLAADLGFTVEEGHVALSGTCRECRERAGTEHS